MPHRGCCLHVYPLEVPLQFPARYSPASHVTLAHCRHTNPSVVPAQLPVRYLPSEQLLFWHALHLSSFFAKSPQVFPVPHEPEPYSPSPHLMFWHPEHDESASSVQYSDTYSLLGQVLQSEHWVSNVPAQPPVLYLNTGAVRHVAQAAQSVLVVDEQAWV